MHHSVKLFFTLALMASVAQANCEIPKGNEPPEFHQKNKQVCIEEASFVVTPPDLSLPEMAAELSNPKMKKQAILNTDTVYCRYHYQQQNGNSAKFRCARTNEKNQLLDAKGNIVPEATQLIEKDDDVYLADANGAVIRDLKADVMKIRYFYKDLRNSENYTSSATSRILWVLGVPAHTNIMTNEVNCFGCGDHPFKQKSPTNSVTKFKDASIEIKFKGKRIYEPTQNSWSWSDLNSNLAKNIWDKQKVTEIEIMAIASNLLGYTSENSSQNAIVCTEKDETNENLCKKTYVMTHDVGAALGRRSDSLFKSTNPRGDIDAYEKATVFKKNSCEFAYSSGNKLPRSVSKEGRDAFLERSKSLTPEVLKTIFSATHLGHLKTDGSAKAVAASEARWTNSVLQKIAEVRNAPCK